MEQETLYQGLLASDVTYPQERFYAYLKLFSHAWNFGRFDLGTFILEWISYLIFTAFIVVRVSGLVKWDIAYISIPFYIALGLGCLRTAFCGKRSRCAMGTRAFFVTFTIVLYIFLILRVESYVNWWWDAVFSPLYILLAILLVSVGGYWIWVVLSINKDPLFKGCMFAMWTIFPCGLAFVHFVADKLDRITAGLSWWHTFAPLWVAHGVILFATPFFFIYFPDRPFLLDRVGPSFGKSIKPRYRVNLLFLTAAVLNIPIIIFEVLLCFHLEKRIIPLPVVLCPIFIAEILALILLLLLSAARKQRGTYCVRIDAGPGTPIRELW